MKRLDRGFQNAVIILYLVFNIIGKAYVMLTQKKRKLYSNGGLNPSLNLDPIFFIAAHRDECNGHYTVYGI